VHRPLAGERIDPPPEARGVVRRLHRHHRGQHPFLHRLLEHLRLEHAQHVGAGLDVARQSTESLSLNSASERFCGGISVGGRAAEARRLGKAEFLRPEARERRQALAERVEAA
jgi:hypothetical protein